MSEHIRNEEVIAKANLEINKEDSLTTNWEQFKVAKEVANENYKEITLVGDPILKRQEILLGHIIRLPTSDLMRQVTFNEQLQRPHQMYKRVGHPRSNWTDDNLQRAHEKYGMNDGSFNNRNADHIELIRGAALARVF